MSLWERFTGNHVMLLHIALGTQGFEESFFTCLLGFKGEWMAKKESLLFIGGLGKEWTTITGELVNYFPQWVKAVTYQGAVHHISWINNYNAMREKTGYQYPGKCGTED